MLYFEDLQSDVLQVSGTYELRENEIIRVPVRLDPPPVQSAEPSAAQR